MFGIGPAPDLSQAEADCGLEQRTAYCAVGGRAVAGAALEDQRLQPVAVGGELRKQRRRYRPVRRVSFDAVDQAVDIVELLVDTAVPLADAGADAFGNIIARDCAKRKG